MPDGAKKYMDSGAGKGPGLKGPGSQNAGGQSTGTAQPGSGRATTTARPGVASSSTSAGGHPAPPFDMSIVAVMGVAGLFTMVGTLLL
jgi:1,3-beta-glucanosyltransferase GAS5